MSHVPKHCTLTSLHATIATGSEQPGVQTPDGERTKSEPGSNAVSEESTPGPMLRTQAAAWARNAGAAVFFFLVPV